MSGYEGQTVRLNPNDVPFAFETEEQYLSTVQSFNGYYSLEDGDEEVSLPEGARVIYSEYEQANYEGHAIVIYELNGDLYEVNGYHCSCNGLEGQWEPELTSVAALLKMHEHRIDDDNYGYYGVNPHAIVSRVKAYQNWLEQDAVGKLIQDMLSNPTKDLFYLVGKAIVTDGRIA